MKTNVLLFISAILLSTGLKAQVDRSVQPKPGPPPVINLGKPETFELKNGLKVMVVENHKLPRVSASLILNNGPIFEGEKAGVSSIFGAMIGNGTTTISKDEFNEEIDYLGASLNVGSQSAGFSSLSKHFGRMMELMADVVQNPLLTQEEFEKQQAQVLEGIKAGENSVENAANIAQSALVYGLNHPYGEFTTEETATNVTLDDVTSFYNTYFSPANGLLVFVGDVKFKDVKKLVKKHFGKWENAAPPAYEIPEVKKLSRTEINFIDMPNAVQSNIAIMNTVDLKMGHPDYFATRLANFIFGASDGRLFLNLREDKGYTYGAYSSFGTNEYTAATLKSYATVRNEVTDSAVVEFMKEYKKFKASEVTAKELKDAKAAYVGNFVMALESPSTVANYALNIAIKNLPADFYETYLQKINAVTTEDIQRVAKKYFTEDKARIIIVGKAVDVLPGLEKLPYEINYFDKKSKPTSKPELSKPIPAGVTIETVTDKYIAAIGGKERATEINTIYTLSEGEIQGITLTMSAKVMRPNKQVVIVSGMGQVFSKSAFNGETGYTEQQGMKSEMTADQLEKSKANTVPFPELSFVGNDKISLINIMFIDGKEAYVVAFGDDTKIYYDVNTGLRIKQETDVEAAGQSFKQVFDYFDYKEVEGLMFPHKISMTAGPQQIDFTVKEIRLNKNVEETDFE